MKRKRVTFENQQSPRNSILKSSAFPFAPSLDSEENIFEMELVERMQDISIHPELEEKKSIEEEKGMEEEKILEIATNKSDDQKTLNSGSVKVQWKKKAHYSEEFKRIY